MSRKSNSGGNNGASSSRPPQVPQISRRSSGSFGSNTLHANEDALLVSQSRMQMNTSSHSFDSSTTDEFGFPLNKPGLQRKTSDQSSNKSMSSGSQQLNNQHITQTQRINLDKVITPSHIQQQRRQPQTSAQQQQQSQSSSSGASSQSNNINNTRQRPPVAKRSSSAGAAQNHSRPPHPVRQTRSLSRQSSNSSSASFGRNNSSKSSNNNHKTKTTTGTANNKQSKLKLSKPDPKRYQNHTFQHPSHAMHVTIRKVDLTQRVAFDNRIPAAASSANLQRMLDEMERVRGSRLTSTNDNGLGENGGGGGGGDHKGKITDNPCRISPSPNHMKILEYMQGHNYNNNGDAGFNNGGKIDNSTKRKGNGRVVRQLQWNAACSVDADPWFDGQYHNNDDDDNDDHRSSREQINNHHPPRRKKPSTSSSRGDGRYISINPLTTTKSALPNHSPILTNVKRRLPMRSDVGFSNPPPEEIAIKMEEVKRESEWEEASPRIVLLASGFSLFGSSNDNDDANKSDEVDMDDVVVDEIHPSCRDDMKLWAGGCIPGVPFAGRDLVTAARMSAAFEKEGRDNSVVENGTNDDGRKKVQLGAYSALAPPVDAIFSSSQLLWRPRPFMDRPPGHVYFLACPLDIRFEEGDTEPLFCTLSLYKLGASDAFSGKISEDFFFPAGDWRGNDGTFRSSVDDDTQAIPLQSWRRRKRRAIMSYDPMDVSYRDLYLVIEVFKEAQDSGTSDGPDAKPTSPNNKEKVGSIFKRTLSKTKSKDGDVVTIQTLDGNHNIGGKWSPEHTCGQYLIPVCFGVTSAFSRNDQHWPVGLTAHVPFYSLSEEKSQEDFVDCINNITAKEGHTASKIRGHANILTEYLGGDFLQALLQDSNQISKQSSTDHLLLADVMGDSAISFEGSSGLAATTTVEGRKHRSDLRRLPLSQESGYATSFDIKEVLYLPPRSSARKYEDNITFCSNTNINLMFLYPRLIRVSSEKKKRLTSQNISVRVQIVEQDFSGGSRTFDGAEGIYRAMQAIYNPASPAGGPPLIESFFTKSVDLSNGSHGSNKSGRIKSSIKRDAPLREEIKVRLPDILDRRHFLQFSIFSLNGNKCDALIAETTVPLIISSKESISGGRVTTIVPNGLHRIQLGDDFQVHVETRLASSYHISDPSIATLLRDGPFGNGNAVVHPVFGIPFVDILHTAPGNAIKRHFSALVTTNMMNLVTQKCPSVYFEALFDILGSSTAWYRLSSWDAIDNVIAIIRSLFEILDKTRTSYYQINGPILCSQYCRLLKSFIDTYDEPLLGYQRDDVTDIDVDESVSDWPLDSIDNGDMNGGGDSLMNNGESVQAGARSPSKYRIKTPRSEIKEAPFSRTAYIPTRTEQLKAEAEKYDDDIYAREFFDDDETVASLSTMTSRTVFPMIVESKSILTDPINELREVVEIPLRHGNSILNQEEDEEGFECGKALGFETPIRSKRNSTSTPFTFAGKRAEYVATRVNNVAQLVLAPCVAPEVMTPTRKNTFNGVSKLTSITDRNPFDASSDVEDECPNGTLHTMRGSQACLKLPALVFHPMKEQGDSPDLSTNQTVLLYETITSLWVQSWTSYAASMMGERIIRGSSDTIPTWPYEVVQGTTSNQSSDAVIASSFIRNASFFLPLCLKSLALRCSLHYTTKLIVPMTFLDDFHMRVLVPMTESIALGTMREALSGESGALNADQMLARALSTSEHVLDFFIGLFALLHPSQVASLVLAYFSILEECEDPQSRVPEANNHFRLRRIKCSQQIRLYAVERLAAMPRFIGLNFPLKFSGSYPKKNPSATWMNQRSSSSERIDLIRDYFEKVDRNPSIFWLAELLTSHCLSICHRSCKTIIVEAKAQSSALRFGREVEGSLSRVELLRIESIAFHSILCLYELLIKRNASDSRFQTPSCNTRVAAMVMGPLLEQSVESVSILTRMDAKHKVRCLWLLSVIFTLQEGPEALLRNKMSSFCNKSDQIHKFCRLLKLAGTTCQYFIPSDESFYTLGGLSKEMTQESFNCISATVILLVEECIDHFSTDITDLEKLAKSVFELLLEIMATPQSSVTLLRTLGGSAHALDKFGASVFLNAVRNDLQHWGRVILTMMNSTELSVRAMAVDFFVSLLGGIFNKRGSIDEVSLTFLSVLPEVVAREISLCTVSGLVKSIGDAEMSLWPLRRALADVEDTNPIDDDRIDSQLIPSITLFCRTGQAIIDGVLVEIRLKGASEKLDLRNIAEAQVARPATGFQFGKLPSGSIFDADEESLLEAANFFTPQSSSPQKLRWLFALRDLHVTKRQWSEAAETLVLGAHSLIISLEHLTSTWRPTQFSLWNDQRHSPWLKTIGNTTDCNDSVMRFARAFLEPGGLFAKEQYAYTRQLSARDVCSSLNLVIDQIYLAYAEEDGMEDIAFAHFEELLAKISAAINNVNRRYHSEDINALRRVRALICSKLTPLTEHDILGSPTRKRVESATDYRGGIYVRLILCGNKPDFLKESTTIPTFCEWDSASICRVPVPTIMAAAVMQKRSNNITLEECICKAFAEPLIKAMKDKGAKYPIIVRTSTVDEAVDDSKTYIYVAVVQRMKVMSSASLKSRKFYLRNEEGITEFTVGHKFPYRTSRQRSLVKSRVKIVAR